MRKLWNITNEDEIGEGKVDYRAAVATFGGGNTKCCCRCWQTDLELSALEDVTGACFRVTEFLHSFCISIWFRIFNKPNPRRRTGRREISSFSQKKEGDLNQIRNWKPCRKFTKKWVLELSNGFLEKFTNFQFKEKLWAKMHNSESSAIFKNSNAFLFVKLRKNLKLRELGRGRKSLANKVIGKFRRKFERSFQRNVYST